MGYDLALDGQTVRGNRRRREGTHEREGGFGGGSRATTREAKTTREPVERAIVTTPLQYVRILGRFVEGVPSLIAPDPVKPFRSIDASPMKRAVTRASHVAISRPRERHATPRGACARVDDVHQDSG